MGVYRHARSRSHASILTALCGLGAACAVLAVVIVLAVTA